MAKINPAFTPAMLFSEAPAPNPELVKEIVAEPVLGWRIWRIVQPENIYLTAALVRELESRWKAGVNPFAGLAGPRLSAAAFPEHVWTDKIINALCRAHAHHAPSSNCKCGVWALKDEQKVVDALANYPETVAYGQVQLWGRVIEHADGFRGQHARPASVTVFGEDAKHCPDLSAFYECDVVSGDEPEGVGAERARLAREERARRLAYLGVDRASTVSFDVSAFPDPPKKRGWLRSIWS